MAASSKIVLILAVLMVGSIGGYFALIPESNPVTEVTAKNTTTETDTSKKSDTDDSSTGQRGIPSEFTNNRTRGILGEAVNDVFANQDNSYEKPDTDVATTKPPVIKPRLNRKLVEDGGKDAPYLVDPKTLKKESSTKDIKPTTPEEIKLEIKPAPKYEIYYVKSGDSMTSIAKVWFGDGTMWDLIAKANPYVDPNKLSIGQKLRMPQHDTVRETPTAPTSTSDSVYVVKSGDNLTRIAKIYYKDSEKWALIYDANRKLRKSVV